jgi:hypothetical protein
MTQGTNANRSGSEKEDLLLKALERNISDLKVIKAPSLANYKRKKVSTQTNETYVDTTASGFSTNLLIKNCPYLKWDDSDGRSEFVLVLQKPTKTITIRFEVKSQGGGGSVDDKYPAYFASMKYGASGSNPLRINEDFFAFVLVGEYFANEFKSINGILRFADEQNSLGLKTNVKLFYGLNAIDETIAWIRSIV